MVPVRNEEAALPRCLAALDAQSFAREAFEVVVVDGHSSDASREVAAKFGARVLLDHGVSVAEARNCGIAAARGEVVAFTDADCLPRPDWLARLWARFERDAQLGGAGGAIRMAGFGNAITRFEDALTRAQYRGFITSNVAYRRRVVERVGGFDASLCCGEDWDLWWRVLDSGHRVDFVPGAVVEHCPVENGTFQSFARKQFWYAENDVRCFVKRARAVVSGLREGRPVPVEPTWRVMGPSFTNAAMTTGLATLFVAPPVGLSVAALGAATAAARAMAAARADRREGEGVSLALSDWPKLVAFNVAKLLVRGAGTWSGVVREARAARAT